MEEYSLKKNNQETDEIIKQYVKIRPNYVHLTTQVSRLLEELIKAHKIKHHSIEARTKEVESFSEKIYRKSQKYVDPLNEITDFTGIRIITNFLEEVEQIAAIIENEFVVDRENSIDKGDLLSENEFGYRSVHFVVSLSESRITLPEWRNFSNLKFEIQIRTVLQHAWAGISHTLQYKNEADIPTQLKRNLFRLAGLFEIADEQFLEIKKQHSILSSNAYNIDQNLNSIEINIHTLEKYMTESDQVSELHQIAEEIGFLFDERYRIEEEEEELDSKLINYCEFVGINSIGELDNFLKKSSTEMYSFLSKQLENSSTGTWYVRDEFLICLLLIGFYHEDFDVNLLIKLGWHELNAERVLNVAKEFRFND
ncbi:hypothetical protein B9G55_22845 [Saccharibacillus sp. O16]|nr:hypothetical protein B9G55_22845 [Saccharibacillus sp. O16]